MGQKRNQDGVPRIFVDNQVSFTSDIERVVQVILSPDDGGGGNSLLVDGYTEPQTFTLSSDTDYKIYLYEIRFVFSATSFKFNGNSFGPLPALENGIAIDITADGYTAEMFRVKCNEDFMLFNSPSNFITAGYASDDILSAGLVIGGEIALDPNTSDNIRITINDNLDNSLLNYFRCMVYGVRGD